MKVKTKTKKPKRVSSTKKEVISICPICSLSYKITSKQDKNRYDEHVELCKKMQLIKQKLGFK